MCNIKTAGLSLIAGGFSFFSSYCSVSKNDSTNNNHPITGLSLLNETIENSCSLLNDLLSETAAPWIWPPVIGIISGLILSCSFSNSLFCHKKTQSLHGLR